MKVNSQTITSPIQCAANTEYDCAGSVLTRNYGGWVFVIPNGVNGVTIKGGEFIGGGVKTDSTDGSRIEGITVRGTANAGDGDTGGHSSAISCMGSFTNGRIANNKIYNAAGTAIFLFGGLHESKVTRNLVDTANEGIHWFGRGGPTNRNPEFTYNSILRCRRHGIELQCYGKTYGLIIRKNYCGEWITTPSWNGHMPFSIAMGGRQSRIEEDKGPGPYINEGMIVEDNVADTSGDLLEKFLNGATPWRNTVAYELMGDGFIFRNNFSNGFAHSTLVEYVGPGWTMHDNIFLSHSDKVLIRKGGSGDQQSEVTQGVGYNSPPLRMDNFLGVIGDKPVPAVGYLADLGNPPPPPTMQVKADQPHTYTTYATIECSGTLSGNTVLECCGADRKWFEPKDKATGKTVEIKALPVTIDAAFDPAAYPNWWISFRLRGPNGSSPEIKVQLGQQKDPGAPPPPPPEFIIPGSGGFSLVFPLGPDGNVGLPKWRKA